MKKIKIVAVPPGFAPEEIRKEWVGVELPLATKKELDQDPMLQGRIGNQNVNGYVVLTSKAIVALRAAGKKKGADFWDSLGMGKYLEFKKEVCEVI